MLAFAQQQHRGDLAGQRGEELFQSDDCLVIERVAFVRTVKPQDSDGAFSLGNERRRELDREPLCHHSTSYTSSRTARGSRWPRATARIRLSQSTEARSEERRVGKECRSRW